MLKKHVAPRVPFRGWLFGTSMGGLLALLMLLVFGDVRRRVQPVALVKGQAQRRRQRFAQAGLAAAAHPHHDDGQIAAHSEAVMPPST